MTGFPLKIVTPDGLQFDGTAEELIGDFGFALVSGAAKSGPDAVTNEQLMTQAVAWILAEGRTLNGTGKPFCIGLQLAGTDNEAADGPDGPGPFSDTDPAGPEAGPGGMSPATMTDLTESGPGPGSTDDIDSSLEYLVTSLHLNGLLDRTVIIILDEADGQAIIVHPEREGGFAISEETSEEDVLATILAVAVTENGIRQSLPEGLAGRDLLSLTETGRMKE